MIIAGAGGLGRETLTVLIENDFSDEIIFFDENIEIPSLLYNKFKVLHSLEDVKQYFISGDKRFITAIGAPRIREKISNKLILLGGTITSVISKRTFIFSFHEPYHGVIIQPGAGISYDVELGLGSAIHVNSTIGHCVKVGKYVNIGPCASVIGPCVIGDYSYISAHACILPGIRLGKNVIVSAGKVVDRDLKDYEVV